MRQKGKELLTIHQENLLHGYRLVGIGHKDLEHVEALVLNHFSIVSKEVHANFEVFAAVDIRSHDIVVGTVQKKFSQEFNRLSLGDVTVRLDQHMVVSLKKHIKIDREVAWNNLLVLGQKFLRHC